MEMLGLVCVYLNYSLVLNNFFKKGKIWERENGGFICCYRPFLKEGIKRYLNNLKSKMASVF